MARAEATEPGSEVVSVLRVLARKGTFIFVEDLDALRVVGGDGLTGQRYVVSRVDHGKEMGAPGSPRCSDQEISTGIFNAACNAGFLDSGQVEGTWRLSKIGRLALKRALSRSPDHTCLRGEREGGNGKLRVEGRHGSRGQSKQRSVRAAGNNSETTLTWLHRRKDRMGRPLISPVQFDAGDRLREDFYKSQLNERVTMNWSCARVHGSGPRSQVDDELSLGEVALSARERVRRALSRVGPELSGVLVDVCCFDRGISEAERLADLPQRSGKVVLRLALSALARYYGLDGPGADAAQRRAGRTQHWGSDDYRPSVDGVGLRDESAA